MTKAKFKYRYTDKWGAELHKRTNFSELKLTLLKSLHEMDRNDVKATAYDNKLQDRFYDVVTIARHVYGESVFYYGHRAFEDGTLNESTRTSLNRSLKALYGDGFITYTGNRYASQTNMREWQKNHWRITNEGKKALAASYNGYLKPWLAKNRYVGRSGAYSVSEVAKVPYDDLG